MSERRDVAERLEALCSKIEWSSAPLDKQVVGVCREAAALLRHTSRDEAVCECGHPESDHLMEYWPKERMQCRAGGITEEDTGWQCRCTEFRATTEPEETP